MNSVPTAVPFPWNIHFWPLFILSQLYKLQVKKLKQMHKHSETQTLRYTQMYRNPWLFKFTIFLEEHCDLWNETLSHSQGPKLNLNLWFRSSFSFGTIWIRGIVNIPQWKTMCQSRNGARRVGLQWSKAAGTMQDGSMWNWYVCPSVQGVHLIGEFPWFSVICICHCLQYDDNLES